MTDPITALVAKHKATCRKVTCACDGVTGGTACKRCPCTCGLADELDAVRQASDAHATCAALEVCLRDLTTEAANVLGGDLNNGGNRIWLQRRVDEARALLDRMVA